MNNFEIDLTKVVLANIKNYHIDNYDEQRFGVRKKECLGRLYRFFCKKGFVKITNSEIEIWIHRIFAYNSYYKGLDYLYALLNDEESKALLAKVFAYRILGERKVKLPFVEEYFKALYRIKKGRIKSVKPIHLSFLNWKLPCYDLHPIGYDLKIFYTSAGIYNTFIFNQYFNKKANIIVNKGDTVIDAGGCYGDTALLFSNLVGEEGKVFSFEFIGENLSVFDQNVEINNLQNVEIVKKAVWNISQDFLHFTVNGPGSTTEMRENSVSSIDVESITIDDFVFEKKLNKVDFIKMDIEGSEMNALKGSVNVIKKFKPKLAISLYHKLTDFYDISFFINELGLGYKFYLNHGSMHAEETVLLCIAN